MAVDELSQEINIIGQDIQELGVKRVAIYLPNSVELLNSVFGTRIAQTFRDAC